MPQLLVISQFRFFSVNLVFFPLRFLFYVLVFKNFFVLLAPYVCFHSFS